MSKKSDRAAGKRVWTWTMIGLAIAGVATIASAVVIVNADRDAWDRAMDEQRFLEGACTVEGADVTEVLRGEDTPGTRVTVTMTVHAAGGDRPHVEYAYPDYYWNPASAAQALGRELAPGARLRCAYDPVDPTRAVAIRKARPQQPRPTYGDAWLAFAIAAVLLLGPIAEVLLPASVKAKRTYTSTDT